MNIACGVTNSVVGLLVSLLTVRTCALYVCLPIALVLDTDEEGRENQVRMFCGIYKRHGKGPRKLPFSCILFQC